MLTSIDQIREKIMADLATETDPEQRDALLVHQKRLDLIARLKAKAPAKVASPSPSPSTDPATF